MKNAQLQKRYEKARSAVRRQLKQVLKEEVPELRKRGFFFFFSPVTLCNPTNQQSTNKKKHKKKERKTKALDSLWKNRSNGAVQQWSEISMTSEGRCVPLEL